MEVDNSMNENIAKRLAFIRYLYDEAVRQSEKAEPMFGASVLGFHDAAELFLVLACEHVDVGKRSMQFMAYWEEIKRKVSEGLTQKNGMSRLNEAHVGLKHHGNMPARSAVQEYRSIATLFFKENTPTVFGVEFGGISMVYLVRHLLIKTDLEEAEELRNEGDLEGAISKLAVAFYRVLEDYKERNPLFRGLKWPTRSSSLRGSRSGGPVVSSRFQGGEADKDVSRARRSVRS